MPDDDNDGIDDIVDEFAVDPDNGLTTNIPVFRPFENNDPGTFLFGLGLTGLMTNGTTDYLDQFDPDQLAAGGNGGELGIEDITAGDAFQAVNTQDNAFQYGVNADTDDRPIPGHHRGGRTDLRWGRHRPTSSRRASRSVPATRTTT